MVERNNILQLDLYERPTNYKSCQNFHYLALLRNGLFNSELLEIVDIASY